MVNNLLQNSDILNFFIILTFWTTFFIKLDLNDFTIKGHKLLNISLKDK